MIEYHKTIYTTYGGYVSEINLHKKYDYATDNYLFEADMVAGEVGYIKYPFNMLFETKEEAEWHKEFGCIERTERLELPTLEEFLKTSTFTFKNKDRTEMEMAIWFNSQNNNIKTIRITNLNDWNICCFELPLTKENYTLACRKCKELFLGERK